MAPSDTLCKSSILNGANMNILAKAKASVCCCRMRRLLGLSGSPTLSLYPKYEYEGHPTGPGTFRSAELCFVGINQAISDRIT